MAKDKDGSPRHKSSRGHRGSHRDDDRDRSRSRSRSRGRDARRDRDRDRDRDGQHHHHRSSRAHHEQHHHSHHHHKHSRHDNHTAAAKDDNNNTRRGGRNNRHGPSSSIGPGQVDAVTLAILIIVGMTSIVFISLSIWLYAVRDGWPSGLNQTGSLTWTRLISYATALLIVGLLLIPVIVTTIVSSTTTTGSSARRSRLTLILLCSTGVVILLMMTVTSLLFVSSAGPKFVEDALEQSWENTVGSSNYLAACKLQNANGCFGWKDNSCVGCRPTVDGNYTGCAASQVAICPRCFYRATTRTIGRHDSPVSAAAVLGGDDDISDVVVVNPRLRVVNTKAFPVDVHGEHGHTRLQRTKTRTRRRAWGLHTVVSAGEVLGRRMRSVWDGLIGRGLMESRVRQTTTTDYEMGCFRWVIWRNRELFIPMTVYTIFLILLLTLLMWKACIDSSGRYTR